MACCGWEGVGVLRRRVDRKSEPERRSVAEPARDVDVPAMGLDKAADDREPKPDALMGARAALPVSLEDMRQICGRDAGTRVFHRQLDPRIGPTRANRYAPRARRVLHRVPYEIAPHLHDAAAVGTH